MEWVGAGRVPIVTSVGVARLAGGRCSSWELACLPGLPPSSFSALILNHKLAPGRRSSLQVSWERGDGELTCPREQAGF